MQREIVNAVDRDLCSQNGRLVDAVTGQYLQWCPVCQQWFLAWNTRTVTCGDRCRKALSRAGQVQNA